MAKKMTTADSHSCSCSHAHTETKHTCSHSHVEVDHACSHAHAERTHTCSHTHAHDEAACSCSAVHMETSDSLLYNVLRLGGSALAFLLAYLLPLPRNVQIMLYLLSYAAVGVNVLVTAWKNILLGAVFSEFFLMSIATLGAIAIGEYPEAIAVMFLYLIGETLQDLAVNRSRRSIRDVMNLRADVARVVRDGDEVLVDPMEVAVGEYVYVRPGEKVPVDGILVDGSASLDTSALTGESIPRDAFPGQEILAGTINLNGMLTIESNRAYGDTTISRILAMVEEAAQRKAPTGNLLHDLPAGIRRSLWC